MASRIQRLSDDIDARDLPVDAIVETLADRRCRTVLEHFVRHSGSADVDELASCFPRPDGDSVPCSNGNSGGVSDDGDRDSSGDASGDASDELRKRIAYRLHHVVLPKLADAGLVRYDPATNVAELAEPPRRVDEYLRRTGRYGLA